MSWSTATNTVLGPSQPGSSACRRGPKDMTEITRSAPFDRFLDASDRCRRVDAVDGRRLARKGCRPLAVQIDQPNLGARQEVADDRQVAVRLHPCPQDGNASRAGTRGLSPWQEVADGRSADGGGPLSRDCRSVHHGQRLTGDGVVQDDEGVIRGQTETRVPREPRDPLDPDQVGRAIFGLPAQQGRHGLCQGPRRTRMDTQLRRQLRVAAESEHRLLGQRKPLLQGRHGSGNLGCGEVSERLHGTWSSTTRSRRGRSGSDIER